jgi:hypothetical protein
MMAAMVSPFRLAPALAALGLALTLGCGKVNPTAPPDAGCNGSFCGGTCVPFDDPANCGGCGNACSGMTPVCTASGTSYECACAAPYEVCADACSDPRTDAKNCGECGHDCGTAACADGMCVPTVMASGPAATPSAVLTLDATNKLLYVGSTDPAAGQITSVPLAMPGVTTPVAAVGGAVKGLHLGNVANLLLFSADLPTGAEFAQVTLPAGAITKITTPAATSITNLAVGFGGVMFLGLQTADTWQFFFYFPGGGPATVNLMGMGNGTLGNIDADMNDVGVVNLTTGEMLYAQGPTQPIPALGAMLHVHAFAYNQAGRVYATTTDGMIVAAGAQGQMPAPIVTGLMTPDAIAADATGIYWTDTTAKTLTRANPDGSSPTVLAKGQTFAPGVLVLSATDVYWVDTAAHEVRRVPR